MEGVRARLILHSGGFVLGVLLSIWAGSRGMSARYVLTAASLLLLVSLIQMTQRYRSAGLIMESRLHSVCCMAVSESRNNEDPRQMENVTVVISAFGILVGHKVYKFNRDGVRLLSMEIGRREMRLSFGSADKRRSILLLHGFSAKEETQAFRDAVAYETGVVPELSGWEGSA